MRKLFYLGIYIAACWGIGYSIGFVQEYYLQQEEATE